MSNLPIDTDLQQQEAASPQRVVVRSSLRYLPIIENNYPLDQLLKNVNLVSTLFMAEAHYDRQRLIQQLFSLYEQNDSFAVSALANWFQQMTIHKRIPAEEVRRQANALLK